MSTKKKNLIIQTFCIAMGVWILFLALVPTLLTKGGLKILVNKKLPGNFSFESAQLSWLSSQNLKGISYQSKEEGLDLTIESFSTKSSLLSLLLNRKNLKETHIAGLDGSFNISKQHTHLLISGFNNDEPKQASAKSSVEPPPFMLLAIPFIGKLHIDQSQFAFKSTEYETITFKEIQFNCNMVSKSGPLLCNLACESTQNELSGSAFFNFELGGFDEKNRLVLTPFDKDLFFLSPNGYLKLNAQLTNLPSVGFDHFVHFSNPKWAGLMSSLLGDSLNLGSQVNIIKGKANVNLMADAPNLNLKFSGSLVQNEFVLDEASVCNCKLSPAFVNALTKIWHLDASILKATQASIHLDRLSFPLDFKNFNLGSLSCNAQFSMGEMEFSPNCSLNALKIEQIKGVIDSFDIGENVTFHLKGAAESESHPISVKADGQISKLLNFKELKGIEHLHGNFQLELKDMPSQFLTFLSKRKQFYNELLGPTTHLNLKFNGSPTLGFMTLSLNSSRLDLPEALFEIKKDSKIQLTKQVSINYRVNPTLSKLVLNPKFALLHPFEVEGKIKKLDFSISKEGSELLDIDSKFTLKSFETSYENSKPIHVQDTKIYVCKNDSLKFETRAYFTALFPEEFDRNIFGNFFDFSLVFGGVPLLSQQTNFDFLGLIKGKSFNANFSGSIDPSFHVTIDKPLTAKILPFKTDIKGVLLQAKQNLDISVDPFSFSLSSLTTEKLNIKGTLKTTQLDLLKGESRHSLSNIEVPFEYKDHHQSLIFSLLSQNTKLDCRGTFKNFQISNPLHFDFQLQGKIKGAKSSIIELFLNQDLSYPNLIGDHFDLHFELSGHKNPLLESRVSYSFVSPLLTSKGVFSIDEELFINDPLKVNYTLTPGNYKHLAQVFKVDVLNSIELCDTSRLEVELSRFQKKLTPLFSLPEVFEGEITANRIAMTKGQIHDLQGEFETPNLNEIIKLKLKGKTCSTANDTGDFCIYADFINPLKGMKSTGNMHAQLHSFPSDFFEGYTSASLPLFSSLGSSLNLDAKMQLIEGKGPLTVALHSDLIKGTAHFNYDQSLLSLDQDLHLELHLSENLAQNWLKHINPLFLSASYCEMPLLLSIKKEGFKYPLNSFDISLLKIPKASLEVNKLTLNHPSHIGELLVLFNKNHESNTINSWFTTHYFSVENGKLHLKPTHFQLDEKYHLAIWGSTDLKRKDNLFYLGIPQNTLKAEFNVFSIPDYFMFQIPIHNQDNQIKANWKKAIHDLKCLASVEAIDSDIEHPISNIKVQEAVAQFRPDFFRETNPTSLPWSEKEQSVDVDTKPEILPDSSQSEQNQILQNFFQKVREKLKS